MSRLQSRNAASRISSLRREAVESVHSGSLFIVVRCFQVFSLQVIDEHGHIDMTGYFCVYDRHKKAAVTLSNQLRQPLFYFCICFCLNVCFHFRFSFCLLFSSQPARQEIRDGRSSRRSPGQPVGTGHRRVHPPPGSHRSSWQSGCHEPAHRCLHLRWQGWP